MLDAVSKIKTEKASGKDKLEPEMVKWLGYTGLDWIWRIFMGDIKQTILLIHKKERKQNVKTTEQYVYHIQE